MYWSGDLMNNLLSYCWLVDAKIRASDQDLPVHISKKKDYIRLRSMYYVLYNIEYRADNIHITFTVQI